MSILCEPVLNDGLRPAKLVAEEGARPSFECGKVLALWVLRGWLVGLPLGCVPVYGDCHDLQSISAQ
jgi:hypothetical protein